MSDETAAYNAGYAVGQLIAEEALRERIAQEVESMCQGIVPMYRPCSHCQDAAKIVRGEK
jgi:ribosomal protein L18